jgi:tetratricopeptide (TPR) repeat protein
MNLKKEIIVKLFFVCNISIVLYGSLCHIPILATESDSHKTLAQEYLHRGRQKARENKLTEALDFYHKALELDPQSADAHFYLGNSAFQQQDIPRAISHYQKSIELNPNHAETYCNLGICANLHNEIDWAIECFQQALVVEQNNWLANTQLSLLFEKKNNYNAAIAHAKKACTADPQNTDLLLYAAHLLTQCDLYEEALTFYDKALQKNPDLTGVLYNIGFAHKKLGHLEEAIAMYKKVIAQKPEYPLVHLSLALAYLALEDFDRGWLEYEWRWAAYDEEKKVFPQPMWDGSDLHNKRIYVYAEQGLGDTFQFMRYLKLLKENGAYVIFHAQVPLKQILQRCPYIDQLITFKDSVPPFDYHISLLSLPLVFNTRIDTIPADIPYLYADPRLVEEWRLLLARDAGFKIGICWQGNTEYTSDFLRQAVAEKSCSVDTFACLSAIPGVSLYSLQRIEGVEQNALGGEQTFVTTFDNDFDTHNGRFMDTAAVIKNLDLVISVDTGLAHCAAALGTPTWIILPKIADWRWMLKRSDTPWYPNVRLFRQATRGDWNSVMREIMQTLKESIHNTKNIH